MSSVLTAPNIRHVTGCIPPGQVVCAGCGGALDIHQPVRTDPGRLLGTCECGRWFVLIEVAGPHWASAISLEIPSTNAVLAMAGEDARY